MKYIFIIIINLILLQLDAQHADWLVQFDAPYSVTQDGKASKGMELSPISKALNIYRVITPQALTLNEVDSKLKSISSSKIKSIIPNLPIEKRNSSPNDFFYEDQWNLQVIKANKAWEQSTGGLDMDGNEIIIAILDDGYDLFHEDLRDNYWYNPNEIPDDGIDNDGNGYIDDNMGVNIQTGTGIHAGVKHGTQVAGIIGAQGNNGLGIAGISWNTQMLIVSGVSNIGEVIKGMEYLYELKRLYIESNGSRGANIVVNNFSGGLKRLFPSDFPSWCEVYDLLGSVGILSVGAVANEDFDVEIEGDMPTLCESDYLVMVTNTDFRDEKVSDAAYGHFSVDLGAPGENIISSSIGNDYDEISGTSASAPHVTGAIALLYSLPCAQLNSLIKNNPSLASLEIKEALLNSVDSKESLEETVSGGRLNIFKAMLELRQLCGTPDSGELDLSLHSNLQTSSSINNAFEISYKTDQLGQHTLSIFSVLGENIYSLKFTPPVFENRSLALNLSRNNLAPGMYIVRLDNGTNSVSKPFIFQK